MGYYFREGSLRQPLPQYVAGYYMGKRKKADLQKKQMLKDVRGEISGLAVDIASKVVEREISQKDYDGFVDQFIQNVGEEQ